MAKAMVVLRPSFLLTRIPSPRDVELAAADRLLISIAYTFVHIFALGTNVMIAARLFPNIGGAPNEEARKRGDREPPKKRERKSPTSPPAKQ